jgi:spore germination protein (amino acid permease)
MDKLNIKQLMFFIWGTSIVAMKTYPNVFIMHAGRDAWISVVFASIIFLAFFTYILSVCKKNNCYDMNKIYHKALGKTLGNIFLILFIITLIITLIESASVEANAMHVNLLSETPPWFFLLFILIPGIYVTEKGTRAITIVTIMIIFLTFVAGINLGILTARYKDYSYLLPIMAHGVTPSFILSIIKALGCFGSIAICIPFLSKVTNKSKITKYCVIAILIVIQMEIVATQGILTTFGEERAININYPKLIQTQLVSYFDFVEGGEFYVMLQMVGGWFAKYFLTLNATLILLKNFSMFNKYTIYIVSIIVFIFSYFISAKVTMVYQFLNVYVYLSVASFVLIPTIIFTIFHFRNKNI